MALERPRHREDDPMRWDRRDALIALGLALAAVAFFWPLFVPGAGRHYFAGGDFVDQFYAFARFEASEFAAGRVPLWNPLAYAGSPFWADIQSAVAYPPGLAAVLASIAAFGRLPLLALEIQVVAHFALAGIFTYLLARRVLGARGGALLAAVVFTFSGYLTGYPPLQVAVLETDAWLPLALLGVEWIVAGAPRVRRVAPAPDTNSDVADPGASAGPTRTTRPRGSTGLGVIVVALALGMAILAGHPQSALYVVYATVAYLAWRTWPWGGRALRPWLATGSAIAGAAGLSAAGWLPALEFLRLSNRATVDYATVSHGFPPGELFGLVLPGITHWSPLYIGVLPLMLAAAGAARVLAARDERERRARFWVVVGIVALLLSLGSAGGLFDLFYLFAPGFGLFRGQERAAFLVAFSLAMLAGLGYEVWQAERQRIGRALAAGSAALLLVYVAAGTLATGEVRLSALWNVLFAGWALFAVLAAAAGSWPGRRLLIVALALVAVDLYHAGGRTNLVPTAPGELQVTGDVAMMRVEGARRVDNEDRLPRNFGIMHGIEAVSGASPLRLRTFEQFHDALKRGAETRLWGMLAVSHVLTWRTDLEAVAEPAITVGTGDARSVLWRLRESWPYAWRASAAEHVSDEAALARLADPGFHPLDTVLLHGTGPDAEYRAASTVGHGTRTIGATVVTTSGEAPGWMVFSEIHYPGWQATIDGASAPVLRADVALIAVPVPAGTHEVRLAFHAPSVRIGLLISILFAVAMVGAVVWVGWR
jgi:hypothetical protein